MKNFSYLAILTLLISCGDCYLDSCDKNFSCELDGYKQINSSCRSYSIKRPVTIDTSPTSIAGDSISDYTIRLGYFDEESLTFYVKHKKNYLPNGEYLRYNKLERGDDGYNDGGKSFRKFQKATRGWQPDVNEVTVSSFNPKGRLDRMVSSIVDKTRKAFIRKDIGKIDFVTSALPISETGDIRIYDKEKTDSSDLYFLEDVSYSDIKFVSY